jgi:hypothetical protein
MVASPEGRSLSGVLFALQNALNDECIRGDKMEVREVYKSIDRLKVAHVVGKLKGCYQMLESADLWLESIDDVLNFCGIYLKLNDREKDMVEDVLADMVMHDEVQEAFRWAMFNLTPGTEMRERPMPDEDTLIKRHKLWAASEREKRGESAEEEIRRRAEHLHCAIHCEVI